MAKSESAIVRVDFECGCSVRFADEIPVEKIFCSNHLHTDNLCGCYTIGGELSRCRRHFRKYVVINAFFAVIVLVLIGLVLLQELCFDQELPRLPHLRWYEVF